MVRRWRSRPTGGENDAPSSVMRRNAVIPIPQDAPHQGRREVIPLLGQGVQLGERGSNNIVPGHESTRDMKRRKLRWNKLYHPYIRAHLPPEWKEARHRANTPLSRRLKSRTKLPKHNFVREKVPAKRVIIEYPPSPPLNLEMAALAEEMSTECPTPPAVVGQSLSLQEAGRSQGIQTPFGRPQSTDQC